MPGDFNRFISIKSGVLQCGKPRSFSPLNSIPIYIEKFLGDVAFDVNIYHSSLI